MVKFRLFQKSQDMARKRLNELNERLNELKKFYSEDFYDGDSDDVPPVQLPKGSLARNFQGFTKLITEEEKGLEGNF